MDIVEKRFDIQIAQSGQTVSGKFELDKTVKVIKGVKVTSDREDLLFYRGTQKIEINGKERFEENYESKNLQSSLNVDLNNRYKNMRDTDPGNGIVSITYKDNQHQLFAFAAYRVSLYVQYEI
ncbi:MAG: hypothetical protein Q7W13_07695 [Bacteroidia bacterium]|nr:hypothetical protein [Bacteroidia bacterium]